MPNFVRETQHHVATIFLRNAMSKAEVARNHLWDFGAPERCGPRQVESLASILMAWLGIEGMVNEAVYAVFHGHEVPGQLVRSGEKRSQQEVRLRACVESISGASRVAEITSLLDRLREARLFRNRLVHYSPHKNPSKANWAGRVFGNGMAVGWMLLAPPTSYEEGLLEQIDPERACQFCAVGIQVGAIVYQALGLSPDLGARIAASSIESTLLPHAPTLVDLMNGIPIFHVERYIRALRVAEQYPEQWWVLEKDGRRRPYRLGEDLKPETILTAFEDEPTEENLGEWWDLYDASIPPLAMRTKRIVRGPSGEWQLADPEGRSLIPPNVDWSDDSQPA